MFRGERPITSLGSYYFTSLSPLNMLPLSPYCETVLQLFRPVGCTVLRPRLLPVSRHDRPSTDDGTMGLAKQS